MTARKRRILATVILTITLGVTAGGTAQARPTPPSPAPSYVSTSIPDTPAGRQLGWLLEAAKNLPIPVPVLEEHLSAAFLAQFSPDQLEGLPGASAAARFLGVVSMTPTSIDAAIDPGSAQAPLVLSLTVDGDGKIAGLRPKFIPLPSRAERGLDPVSLPRPTGRLAVGTETVVTVDGTRGGRKLPVQLWYPADRRSARKSPPSQYAPPMTSAACWPRSWLFPSRTWPPSGRTPLLGRRWPRPPGGFRWWSSRRASVSRGPCTAVSPPTWPVRLSPADRQRRGLPLSR